MGLDGKRALGTLASPGPVCGRRTLRRKLASALGQDSLADTDVRVFARLILTASSGEIKGPSTRAPARSGLHFDITRPVRAQRVLKVQTCEDAQAAVVALTLLAVTEATSNATSEAIREPPWCPRGIACRKKQNPETKRRRTTGQRKPRQNRGHRPRKTTPTPKPRCACGRALRRVSRRGFYPNERGRRPYGFSPSGISTMGPAQVAGAGRSIELFGSHVPNQRLWQQPWRWFCRCPWNLRNRIRGPRPGAVPAASRVQSRYTKNRCANNQADLATRHPGLSRYHTN